MNEEETVRRILAAWTTGIEAFVEFLAPDVEWYAPPGFPEGEVWKGREAVSEVLRGVFGSVFTGQGVDPDEIVRGRESAARRAGVDG